MKSTYKVPDFLDVVLRRNIELPDIDIYPKERSMLIKVIDERQDILKNLVKFCLENNPLNRAIYKIFKSIRFVSDIEKNVSKLAYFNSSEEVSDNFNNIILNSPYGHERFIIKYKDLPIFENEKISFRTITLFRGTRKELRNNLFTPWYYTWEKSKKNLKISFEYFSLADFNTFMLFGKDKIKRELGKDYPIELK